MKETTAAAIMLMTAATISDSRAAAADAGDDYAFEGAGRASCAAYLEARELNDYLDVFAGWIDGYVTSFNRLNPDTYDLTGWQGVALLQARLAAICESRPEARFAEAMKQLTDDLSEDRLTETSETTQLRVGPHAMVLYRAMLPRIHAALTAAGYRPGSDDASFSDDMVEALRRFQAAGSLPVTGLPDQETLNALFP